MPHLVMLYTPQLNAEVDMPGFCRRLADTMLSVKDERGAQVFPTAGTRVLAYPAAHCAVADGRGDRDGQGQVLGVEQAQRNAHQQQSSGR